MNPLKTLAKAAAILESPHPLAEFIQARQGAILAETEGIRLDSPEPQAELRALAEYSENNSK